ncbi:MAG: arylesterase [Alcanivoracaceae bacterium]
MRFRWLVGFPALLLSALVHAQGVLVLGDSISAAYGIDKEQGWVALLQSRLDEHCSGVAVNNASVSGETTAGGRVRLPALLEQHQPELLIIELGGNDGLRGLSPVAMEENLVQMVDAARAANVPVLLLGMYLPANYGEAYLKLFADVFQRVAREQGVPLVPFFLEGVGDTPDLMQDDGVHPVADAQPILLENAWPAIVPLLPPRCDVPVLAKNGEAS